MLDYAVRGTTMDKTFPRFMTKPVHMAFLSEKEGRPIYEDRSYVEIISPGMAKSIPCEEVTEDHKSRWPREWEAFQKGLDLAATGTPLEQWPQMTPSTVMTLKALNIRTVEELSTINDAAIQNLGTGGREMREKAKRFLALAESSAPMEEAVARAEKAEADRDYFKGELDKLAARLDAMETKRGPGRPPKAIVEPDDEQEAA